MSESASENANISSPQLSDETFSRPKSAALGLVAALLFLSGMCGLIFQVSWFREFRLVFGASTAASSAVLAVFMGGLGIGNAVLGKWADRTKNPLAMYALLELSIAVMAAVSPLLIDALHGFYIQLGGQQAIGVSAATGVRLVISMVVMGIPTFLMGGTLPAAVRVVTSSEDHERRGAAVLYGINTLGAVVGAFASTFFALEFFGTRGTLWLAGLVNTFTALCAFGLSRGLVFAVTSKSEVKPVANSKEDLAEKQTNPSGVPASMVYVVAGVVGFAFFLMELVWYRMLGPILGGSTFTFGLILAVALTGIGLGGVAYAFLFKQRSVTAQGLAITCLLEAVCIGFPFVLGDRLAILAARMHGQNTGQFFGEVAGWGVIAAMVILPAAFVSGIQFPLFIALLGKGDKDVGKQVGLAFTWNTVGAICGSLAGGFGLLPLLSAPGVWRMVASLMAILGLCVVVSFWRQATKNGLKYITLAAVMVVMAMVMAPGPTAVWRHGGIGAGRSSFSATMNYNSLRNWQNGIRRSFLWEEEGVESSVAISKSNSLAFYVNGKCDGNSIGDAGTQIMLGLIGGILHPDPKTAIVVGLGTGETAGWLAAVPSVERVDVVELEPAVTEVARRCRSVNHDVMSHPKVRTIFNDAREVLLTTDSRYDLIACEPSNPYRSGIANLFTQEFYRAGAQRLNENGLFLQWVQTYEIDDRTMRTIFATFKSIFPHVEVWETRDSDMVLVGSLRKLEYSVPRLRSTVAREPFVSALKQAWHTSDLEGFLSHYVGGMALVDQFVAGGLAPINTDDRNQIEYGFARTVGRNDLSVSATLHRKSVEMGDSCPAVIDGEVNRDAMNLDRQWFELVRTGRMLKNGERTVHQQSYEKVLQRYQALDTPGMLAAWETLPHSTTCLTELTMIALAYAFTGNEKAEPLIEQLRSQQPSEAEAIRGILHWKQKKTKEAAEQLAAALQRLHQDPWPLQNVVEKALDAAIEVAQADPEQAPLLLKAVDSPFDVYRVEDNRLSSACFIAKGVDIASVARCLEAYEPHIPWTKKFLTFRQQAYTAAGHPLASQAQRDLDKFNRRAEETPATKTGR